MQSGGRYEGFFILFYTENPKHKASKHALATGKASPMPRVDKLLET